MSESSTNKSHLNIDFKALEKYDEVIWFKMKKLIDSKQLFFDKMCKQAEMLGFIPYKEYNLKYRIQVTFLIIENIKLLLNAKSVRLLYGNLALKRMNLFTFISTQEGRYEIFYREIFKLFVSTGYG